MRYRRAARSQVGVESMARVARTLQRALAAFLPVNAFLLLIGEWLTPKGLDNPITTTKTALKVLPITVAMLILAVKIWQTAGSPSTSVGT